MRSGAWDVVVVGGGPAGAVAAAGAARVGLRTLLVDRQPLPRWKVCGACLNSAALEVLAWMGQGDLPERSGSPALRALTLTGWGRTATLPLSGSVALSSLMTPSERFTSSSSPSLIPSTASGQSRIGSPILKELR